MLPLSAEILTEQVSQEGRGAVRRSLRLGVQTHASGDVAMALILNISKTGFLIETIVELEVGETLYVDIPEASASSARVVWMDGLLAGCEFVTPVSTRALSAAELKAPVGSPAPKYQPETRGGDTQRGVAPWERDQATFEWTIVMISALISAVALIVFLVAVLPL